MYLTQVDYDIPLISVSSTTPISSSEQSCDPFQEKMKYLSKEEVSGTILALYTKVHL